MYDCIPGARVCVCACVRMYAGNSYVYVCVVPSLLPGRFVSADTRVLVQSAHDLQV